MSKSKKLPLLLLSAIILSGGLGTVHAETLDKAAVEDIIKEFLTNNPDVILDSLENYRKDQQKNFKADAQKKIKENMDKLTDASAPFVGNAEGDITIVEFFDYNCGYCKRAVPDIQDLIKEDKNVKVIFKEMPILSPESVTAAKWALAAHKQNKYFEYHAALMKERGRQSPQSLKELARDLGLDLDQLEKDAQSDEIAKLLEKDQNLAREIGVQGTPAFIINGEFYPGYLGPDGLLDAIEKARDGKKG